jgi:hypothetical protein
MSDNTKPPADPAEKPKKQPPPPDPRNIPGAAIKLVIVTEKGEKMALRCRLLAGVTPADVDKAMQRGVLRVVPDQ